MNDFFIIIKNDKLYNHNFLKKILNLCLSILIIFMLIAVISLIVIYPLDYFIKNVLHFESIKSLMKQRQNLVTGLYPIYLIAFIGPLIEEILFRLALKLNELNISIFLGMLSYKFIGGQITKFDIHNSFYIYCIIVSITISIISYIFFPTKIIAFLNQRINLLIITSIFLFGLMHIFNIDILHWQLVFFYPFFVLPQMVSGYFITNLRLKYDFFWGFLLHAFINITPLLLSHKI